MQHCLLTLGQRTVTGEEQWAGHSAVAEVAGSPAYLIAHMGTLVTEKTEKGLCMLTYTASMLVLGLSEAPEHLVCFSLQLHMDCTVFHLQGEKSLRGTWEPESLFF